MTEPTMAELVIPGDVMVTRYGPMLVMNQFIMDADTPSGVIVRIIGLLDLPTGPETYYCNVDPIDMMELIPAASQPSAG